MYKNNVNRILSIMLIVCMIITMAPINVFAENTILYTANSNFAGYNQLIKITDYYAAFESSKRISAPMEGVARFAVGYPASKNELPENESTLKSIETEIYALKYYSFESKYGEQAEAFTEKEWFSSQGINTQTWLSQIILDIISVGGDPSNYGGRNYVYELMKYQSKATHGLFSNLGKYAGSADGLSTLALNAYWGDEWALTNEAEGLGKVATVQAMIDNYQYTYGGADGGKVDLATFRKGKEWGLGTVGSRMTQDAVYYNVFWLSQGLSSFAYDTSTTGSAITTSAISQSNSSSGINGILVQEKLEDIAMKLKNKNVMGQSFETIRKAQCELQAAYIISLLSAGIAVDENEWAELAKFQLDDGSYKRKADDLVFNGEATAMAAIALDYGNRISNGENRTSCSAFNRLQYNGNTSTVKDDIAYVLSDQKALRSSIENESDFNVLLNNVRTACADTSYKSELSFFSKTPQGILVYNDVIMPKDGEPDIFVGLVLAIRHGSTMDVVESQGFVLKSEDKTFPLSKNEKLLKDHYIGIKDKKGLTSSAEPVAVLSLLGKDILSQIPNNLSFYPVQNADRYEGDYSYYSTAGNFYFPETMAIIDEIALGKNPKNYLRASQGTGEIKEVDLVNELLAKQLENGSFSDNYLLCDIDSVLALEIFFNGNDWGNNENGTQKGRVGAIESLLSYMTDCQGVENGRSYGKFLVGSSGTGVLDSWVSQQSETVILLSRWLNDETIITVNGISGELKGFAQKEIDGLIKTLNAVYDGQFTNGKCGFKKIDAYSKYISALVASGNKQTIDDKNVWDVLRNSRLTNGTYPVFLHDIDNPIAQNQKLSANKQYTAYVAMAMGDYVNNRAMLSTLSFDISGVSDEEAVNNDLASLHIPDTITENITLTSKGFYGSNITWISSNNDIINQNTGIVTRPMIGQANSVVKLTATVSRNSYIKTYEFYVVVLAMGSEEQEIVSADYDILDIPPFVTADLSLPIKGVNGSDITWKSSNESVVTNDGKVTLKEIETKLVLTATLSKGAYSRTKEFYITVSKIIDNNNVVEKAINQLKEVYNTKRNLTGIYWDVFAAKSVLGDDFDKYNFKVYDVKSHRKGSAWQGTDYAAIVLQILSQGDNPYNYQGVNYVEQLLNWIAKNGWGAWGSPSWTLMALDAAAADYEGYSFKARDVLGSYLAELKNLQYGPDLAGWALIPLSTHINDDETFRDERIIPALEELKLTLKNSQEKLGKNKGLFNTGGVEGGILTLSNGCVVSGFEALTAAGLPGFDLTDNYWKIDGTGVLEAIYNIDIVGKQNISNQEIIEFGDVYYSDSLWKRVGIKKSDFITLISTANELVENKKSDYTIISYNDLKLAYDNAVSVNNNVDKMSKNYYGPAYFALRDAIDNLKPAGVVSVKILGDKNKEIIIESATVSKTGTVLEVIEEISKQNKISLTVHDNKIREIGGLVARENQDWYCYEKTSTGATCITNPLNTYKIKEGTELVFKYCSDTTSLKQGSTLDEHLVHDGKNALVIGGTIDSNYIVTGDLVLQNSGLFGTTISWTSNKLFAIDENGKVNRDEKEDVKVSLTAKIYLNGVQTEKNYDVIVKSKSGGSTTPIDKYAYISVVGQVGTGKVFFRKKAIKIEPGETAFSLLEKTNLSLDIDRNTQYGVYVSGIEGLSEMDEGPESGWLYRVNGVFPGHSAALERVYENDYVEWLYTRDLGKDVGGYMPGVENGTNSSQSGSPATVSAKATISNGIATLITNSDDILKAIEDAKKNNINSISIAPIIEGEVNRVNIQIDKSSLGKIADNKSLNLNIITPIATITIPNKSLLDIEKNVGSVIMITTTKNTDNTISVEVEVGNKLIEDMDGGISIVLSGNNFSNSTVLAKVCDDDTIKIIKKSFVEGKNIYGFIDGSVTIKIIDNIKIFEDISNDSWYREAVLFAAGRELFGGTSDKMFNPNIPMSRAMLVTVLHRLEDTPNIQNNNINFVDVNIESYYGNAVSWATAEKIVNGTGNAFNPNNDITREELITILYRYAKCINTDTSIENNVINFSDKNYISEWAYEAMSWAVENGIIDGKENKLIDPKGKSTRAEVAIILERFIKNLLK